MDYKFFLATHILFVMQPPKYISQVMQRRAMNYRNRARQSTDCMVLSFSRCSVEYANNTLTRISYVRNAWMQFDEQCRRNSQIHSSKTSRSFTDTLSCLNLRYYKSAVHKIISSYFRLQLTNSRNAR